MFFGVQCDHITALGVGVVINGCIKCLVELETGKNSLIPKGPLDFGPLHP